MCEKQALIDFDLMALKLSRKYSCQGEFDDLYQMAKISIIEAIRTYDSSKGTKLSTYVFSSIIFNLKNYNAKNKSIIYQPSYALQKAERVDFEVVDSLSSDNNFSKVDFKLLLEHAMSTLTEKQRKILKLKYLEGFTISEIASLMDCSHQNISKINSSAISTIQKTLQL